MKMTTKYADLLYPLYGSRLFDVTTFLLFFWLILGFFHLNSSLDHAIYGPHYWRQSDGMAQVMNYVNNGLNFFDFSVYYNQYNGSPKAVGEFPVMYYIIAIQKTVFGGDIYYFFRLNHLVVGFFGLLALFKIAQYFIKNIFVSLVLTFILFCSPVFSFYFLAALPDPLAFNLSLIGYWLLVKYFYQRRPRFLIFAIPVLSLAFMVKLYFIIPFLALLLIVLVNRFLKIDRYCYLPFKWIMLVPVFCGIAWLVFTLWYNGLSSCNCFLSDVMPYWKGTDQENTQIWRMLHDFRYDYLARYIWPVFLAATLYNIVDWNPKYWLQTLFFIIAILGGVAFFVLFFKMFLYHDYYIYPLMFLLPLSVGLAIAKLNERIQIRRLRFQLSFLLLVVMFFGIQQAVPTFDQRKWNTSIFNHESYFEDYRYAECLLDGAGVKKNDLVLSVSDHTPNYSLYLMNRRGWSGYQSFFLQWKPQDFVDRGADYMIINYDCHLWDVDAYSQGYRNHLVANRNELYVYDLRPYRE